MERHPCGEEREEQYEHMAIAAQYYRKAAEEHNFARANFNLGFMHEWGLGLSHHAIAETTQTSFGKHA